MLSLPARSLVDDRALIIAGLLKDDGLGPYLLVVDEGTFKRLAAHEVIEGKEVFVAAFTVHPTDATHWRPVGYTNSSGRSTGHSGPYSRSFGRKAGSWSR